MGQVVSDFKKAHPDYKDSPITFAGRLDPLAEGLVLLLSGFSDEEKKKILEASKEYEFDFVLGFNTDTYDVLGIVTSENVSGSNLSKEKIVSSIRKLKQNKVQEYPPFSSKTVKGKALHQWAREDALDEIDIPKRDIEIFKIDILEMEKVNPKCLLKQIEDSVSLVGGDFRQEEIVSKWRDVLTNTKDDLTLVKMRALVSSGTYIRGLVSSLGKDLECGAVVYSIKRTKIGDMKINS